MLLRNTCHSLTTVRETEAQAMQDFVIDRIQRKVVHRGQTQLGFKEKQEQDLIGTVTLIFSTSFDTFAGPLYICRCTNLAIQDGQQQRQWEVRGTKFITSPHGSAKRMVRQISSKSLFHLYVSEQ